MNLLNLWLDLYLWLLHLNFSLLNCRSPGSSRAFVPDFVRDGMFKKNSTVGLFEIIAFRFTLQVVLYIKPVLWHIFVGVLLVQSPFCHASWFRSSSTFHLWNPSLLLKSFLPFKKSNVRLLLLLAKSFLWLVKYSFFLKAKHINTHAADRMEIHRTHEFSDRETPNVHQRKTTGDLRWSRRMPPATAGSESSGSVSTMTGGEKRINPSGQWLLNSGWLITCRISPSFPQTVCPH